MLPAGLLVGDDAGVERHGLVSPSPDAHRDGGLPALERRAEHLLHAAAAVLEGGREEGGAPDGDLLHDVPRLQLVEVPLVGLGAPGDALDGQHRRALPVVRRNRVGQKLVHSHLLPRPRPLPRGQEALLTRKGGETEPAIAGLSRWRRWGKGPPNRGESAWEGKDQNSPRRSGI